MRSTWEAISASIFDLFPWILGSKLGGKTEPKSIQKGIQKMMKKEGILDGSGGGVVAGTERRRPRVESWTP